ncbi:hypothetical protein ANCCAN_04481 [Ancylostoma caninum]|uniref:Uncharacterized protein n=1 Tax=Ancylostoma caninum TaxID=29170 RepID=A0A368GYF8_ANCCA|nr:hypothetical protein ANCCAN_04481 [Ancylostoma caninum]
MEQRILALSQENHLLKSRLESRTAAESLLQTARPDFASLPSQSNTVLPSTSKARPRDAVHASVADVFCGSAISDGSSVVVAAHHGSQSFTAAGPIAVQYLATSDHAALSTASRHSTAGLILGLNRSIFEFQYRATPSPSVFSIGSAFQPFQAHKESVIMKAERISPDSSSDRVERVIQRVPSPQQQERAPSQSLLGALLASRRTSPAVPQSRTEHHSRLGSPPRVGFQMFFRNRYASYDIYSYGYPNRVSF